MDGNWFGRWVCRPSITSTVLISLAFGLWQPLYVAGSPDGQFPHRPQPSTVPGSLPTAPGQPSIANPGIEPNSRVGPELSRKQRDALVYENFKKTEADAAKLSKLVQSLQEAVDKSNANDLSHSIVRQASKVEKLAKRIRTEATGY
jgi:hypothetical protein